MELQLYVRRHFSLPALSCQTPFEEGMQKTCVRFSCPDVRVSYVKDNDVYRIGDPRWLIVEPGLAYVGTCKNLSCPAKTTVCNVNMGKHRPNEDYCYNQIRCPACQTPFQPECFQFQHCSAKVNFCFEGSAPDELRVSEDRRHKSRVLGKRGQVAVYNLLVIEVDRPGTYEDDGTLDAILLVRRVFSDVLNLSTASTTGSTPKQQPIAPNPPSCKTPNMLNPQDIRYVQDSISSRFMCGRRVVETMNQLLSGLSVDLIPTIRVFHWNGHWHSEDNRRLWAFKKAGLQAVPVRYVDKSSVDPRKFTTQDGGLIIRMR